MDLKCMQRVFFNFARNKRKVRESCVEVPFFFFFFTNWSSTVGGVHAKRLLRPRLW